MALWGRPSQFKANREDILYFSPTMDALEKRFAEINTPIVAVYGERDPFRVYEQLIASGTVNAEEGYPDFKRLPT